MSHSSVQPYGGLHEACPDHLSPYLVNPRLTTCALVGSFLGFIVGGFTSPGRGLRAAGMVSTALAGANALVGRRILQETLSVEQQKPGNPRIGFNGRLDVHGFQAAGALGGFTILALCRGYRNVSSAGKIWSFLGAGAYGCTSGFAAYCFYHPKGMEVAEPILTELKEKTGAWFQQRSQQRRALTREGSRIPMTVAMDLTGPAPSGGSGSPTPSHSAVASESSASLSRDRDEERSVDPRMFALTTRSAEGFCRWYEGFLWWENPPAAEKVLNEAISNEVNERRKIAGFAELIWHEIALWENQLLEAKDDETRKLKISGLELLGGLQYSMWDTTSQSDWRMSQFQKLRMQIQAMKEGKVWLPPDPKEAPETTELMINLIRQYQGHLQEAEKVLAAGALMDMTISDDENPTDETSADEERKQRAELIVEAKRKQESTLAIIRQLEERSRARKDGD